VEDEQPPKSGCLMVIVAVGILWMVVALDKTLPAPEASNNQSDRRGATLPLPIGSACVNMPQYLLAPIIVYAFRLP
jgi:hypothetical protein